jgi:copper chaperone CopZ
MKKIYKLENLECASCASKMEDGIRSLPGVETVSVNS